MIFESSVFYDKHSTDGIIGNEDVWHVPILGISKNNTSMHVRSGTLCTTVEKFDYRQKPWCIWWRQVFGNDLEMPKHLNNKDGTAAKYKLAMLILLIYPTLYQTRSNFRWFRLWQLPLGGTWSMDNENFQPSKFCTAILWYTIGLKPMSIKAHTICLVHNQ